MNTEPGTLEIQKGMFTNFSNKLVNQYQAKELYTPDAMEFVIGSEYINEDPSPFHRICLKTLYCLWDNYPPEDDEQRLLDILRQNWGVTIQTIDPPLINTLILPVGRRGRKSALTVYIASYQAYRLLCKFNPQRYYGLRERHQLHIVHCAVSGPQAQEVFSLGSDLIKRSPAFRDYIDFDKDCETELRLFTPADKLWNDQVDLRNMAVGRGGVKEKKLPGTIYIESITTSSRSSRGGSIQTLLMSEFAHLERAKMTPGGENLSTNPHSDYEVLKALKPSTKDFKNDFILVLESSPVEKGGEFYHYYCLGDGPEQEERPGKPLPGYQVIQLSTWEASPTISLESLESDRIADPIGFECEYGAHFGNPSAQAVPEQLIREATVPGKKLCMFNTGRWTYTISLDPGGSAKKKIGDVYAIAWAHKEETPSGRKKYVIDGFKGFRETLGSSHDGITQIIQVNPYDVMQFLLDLIRDLGGRNWIDQICYDQFNSNEAVAFLQSLGVPAVETTFTNPYKMRMYGSFLSLLNVKQVELYDVDDEGWINVFRQEMKFLQRRSVANTTFYSHPDTGPVQTDDFADVAANCVHQMSVMENPTQQNMRDAVRTGRGMITLPVTVPPQKGPSLAGAGASLRTSPQTLQSIRERFRR